MIKLWCEQQMLDEKGIIICTAHLAESRVFGCPYNDNEERLKAEYPCVDYKEEKVGNSNIYITKQNKRKNRKVEKWSKFNLN